MATYQVGFEVLDLSGLLSIAEDAAANLVASQVAVLARLPRALVHLQSDRMI